MTKLTLGKTLSPQTQAKLDQLTGSSSHSQRDIQISQTKEDQRIKTNLQNISKKKEQSGKQASPQQLKSAQTQDNQENIDTDLQTKVDPQASERRQKQLSYQAFIAACDYLCDTYPQAFNIDDLRPLKLRIEQDIYAHLPVGMSRTKIRQALGSYVTRLDYLQSFEKYTQRIDLAGAFVEDVTEEQKVHADQALKAIMDKQERRRQVMQDKRENYRTSMEQAPTPSTDIDDSQTEFEVASVDQE